MNIYSGVRPWPSRQNCWLWLWSGAQSIYAYRPGVMFAGRQHSLLCIIVCIEYMPRCISYTVGCLSVFLSVSLSVRLYVTRWH